jgi:hypothetical protein
MSSVSVMVTPKLCKNKPKKLDLRLRLGFLEESYDVREKLT